MLELHQYPAVWGLNSLSPFCLKVEDFLLRNGIPYLVVVERNPARGPKGKMPFIRDRGITIADSSFILDHLIREYDLKEKFRLEPSAQAQALAFQRLIEENLYFVLLYSRWLDPTGWAGIRREFLPLFPPLLGDPILRLIRRSLRRQAFEQGIGRHSLEEVYAIGARDLEALSEFLGGKPFLMGSAIQPVDSSLFAFLETIRRQPMRTRLFDLLLERKNLLAYCDRLAASRPKERSTEARNGP
jgi:glutathione S-transferase